MRAQGRASHPVLWRYVPKKCPGDFKVQRVQQRWHIDRLGHMVIRSGPDRLITVMNLAIAGERDQHRFADLGLGAIVRPVHCLPSLIPPTFSAAF